MTDRTTDLGASGTAIDQEDAGMQALAQRSSTPLPSASGPYEVLGRISAGGMAEVFKARRRTDGRTVALKRLLPVLAAEPQYVRMFADEARIVAQLAHPNIARVLDVGQSDGTWYMAQELVDGPDLRAISEKARERSQRMSVPAAVFAAMEVAAALDYAHKRIDPQGRPLGLIHRDVSPGNILIGRTEGVKLVDFGIAKAEHRETQTRNGMIKGKFSYMSPEQARGTPLDTRSDIFSLTAVLFDLVTGERLFDGGTDIETLDRVRRAIVKVPSTLNSAIPHGLDRVMLKALSQAARARYQTAGALRTALTPFLGPGGADAARRELQGFVESLFEQRTATPPPPPAAAFRLATPPPPPTAPQAEASPPAEAAPAVLIEDVPAPPTVQDFEPYELAPLTVRDLDPFEESPTTKWTGNPLEIDLDVMVGLQQIGDNETPTPLRPSRSMGTLNIERPEQRPSKSSPLPVALGVVCIILAVVCMALILTPPRAGRAPASVEVVHATPTNVVPPKTLPAPTPDVPVTEAKAPLAPATPTVVAATPVPAPAAPAVAVVAQPAPKARPTTRIAQAPATRRPARRAPAAAPVARAAPAPIEAPAYASPAPAPTAARASVRPTPQAASYGFIELNTRPWSRVYIDGREAGETPLLRYRLKAGRHAITLVNNKFGLRKEMMVRVKGGETKKVVVDLD